MTLEEKLTKVLTTMHRKAADMVTEGAMTQCNSLYYGGQGVYAGVLALAEIFAEDIPAAKRILEARAQAKQEYQCLSDGTDELLSHVGSGGKDGGFLIH